MLSGPSQSRFRAESAGLGGFSEAETEGHTAALAAGEVKMFRGSRPLGCLHQRRCYMECAVWDHKAESSNPRPVLQASQTSAGCWS